MRDLSIGHVSGTCHQTYLCDLSLRPVCTTCLCDRSANQSLILVSSFTVKQGAAVRTPRYRARSPPPPPTASRRRPMRGAAALSAAAPARPSDSAPPLWERTPSPLHHTWWRCLADTSMDWSAPPRPPHASPRAPPPSPRCRPLHWATAALHGGSVTGRSSREPAVTPPAWCAPRCGHRRHRRQLHPSRLPSAPSRRPRASLPHPPTSALPFQVSL